MTVKFRQMIERRIIRRTISELLKAGYTLGVFDGEEITLRNATNAKVVVNAMMTTDDDHLMVYRDNKSIGWVRFIYGNNGWDVINDYTTNLEPQMAEVQKAADKLEELFG